MEPLLLGLGSAPIPPACLRPVETMKRLCLEEKERVGGQFRLKHPFQEYRLDGAPQSLKALLALFKSVDVWNDLLWITEASFISFQWNLLLPEPYREKKITLEWVETDKNRLGEMFDIYAATFEDAVFCLGCLRSLDDTDMRKSRLSFINNAGSSPTSFPLSDSHLMTMTRQYSRMNFSKVCFTADQSCSLLRCDEISLTQCIFDDGGAAIIEALKNGQQDFCNGWKILELHCRLPFDVRLFCLLLKEMAFDELKLFCMGVNAETCQGLAVAGRITRLVLEECTLDDQGISLLKAIQVGTGPRELRWCGDNTYVMPLINSLRGNTYLEALILCAPNQNVSFWRTLASALRENKGLTTLVIAMFLSEGSHSCDRMAWDQLMEAMSEHPSLHSVKFQCMIFDKCDDGEDKKYRTSLLAQMLTKNPRIDAFHFDPYTLDKAEWDATVVPVLEHNLWRKRFLIIFKNDHLPSTTRAALIGHALSRLQKSSPWIVWLLMRHGSDVIVSIFLEKQRSGVLS